MLVPFSDSQNHRKLSMQILLNPLSLHILHQDILRRISTSVCRQLLFFLRSSQSGFETETSVFVVF